MKKQTNNDFNRAIATLFSVPIFKSIFKNGSSDYFTDKIYQFQRQININDNSTVKDILSKMYKHLTLNYRNEYVYKNLIANKLLLERHNLNEATLINELRVSSSIADIVIINGTNTIYEIKTELDSSDKLRKQVEDYKKISPKIYLVTHHTLIEKYLDLIHEDSIGLISLNEENNLSVIREATFNFEQLNNKTIMETLRKDEYSKIIKEHYGFLPQVSNIKFYKECLKLIEDLNTLDFHKMMLEKHRERTIKEKDFIQSTNTPLELKHICLSYNPNKYEYENFYAFLKLTF